VRINSLTSAANTLLKKIRSLQERNARHKAGLFLIEGEKIMLEALTRGIEIEAVVLETDYFEKGISQTLEEALGNEDYFPEGISLAPPALFKDLITTTTSCGLVAVARPRTASLEEVLAAAAGRSNANAKANENANAPADTNSRQCLVVLEEVQDPGNLGAIMRSALAFGAAGLILSRGTVDPYNPKVVRAAMGALFDLPVIVDVDLPEAIPQIKAAGFAVCALNPEARESLTSISLPARVALLMGNEGAGLSAAVDALADFDLKIEIAPEIESLNVSIATAIVLFHLANVAKASS